jgi:hypothetical protein
MRMKTMRVPVSDLPLRSASRGEDFAAAVREQFPAVDGVHVVPLDEWYALVREKRAGVPRPRLAERVATCEPCDWARLDGSQRFCDHPARTCAKLCPARSSERCPLGKWPLLSMQNDKASPQTQLSRPTIPSPRQRLVDRAARLKKRTEMTGQFLIMARARLNQAEQQHAIALGEHKAIAELVKELPEDPAPDSPPRELKRVTDIVKELAAPDPDLGKATPSAPA